MVKGQGLEYVEVSMDQSRKVITTEVATEPVAEIIEVGTKEVVIPTVPFSEAPVKSDVLVNKVVSDPSTPQVIAKAQPVAPVNTPTSIPADNGKEVCSETVNLTSNFQKQEWNLHLTCFTRSDIFGSNRDGLENKKRLRPS